MPYFTLLFGIALVGLSFYGKFVTGTTSITVYIPAVVGLTYMTFGEGMRSLPKRRRLFLLLAILLSIVGIAGTAKSVQQLPAILRGEELFRDNGSRITPEAVYLQVAMLIGCTVYLVVALLIFFRVQKQVAVSGQQSADS